MLLVAGVIRVSRKDGQSAIHLFREDDASKLVRQRDAAQRKKQIRTLTGGIGPTIRRTDRENETLSAAIAQPANLLSELLGREQLPSAVEQNEMSRSAPRLTVEPLQQPHLGLKKLRVAGDVPSRSFDIIPQ